MVGEREHHLLQRLNDKFDPADMLISVQSQRATLLLRAIDINKLRHTINELSATQTSSLLAEVLQAVENIKSYGIRTGKRYFVGYADERKVKDRANKELRRGKHYYANDHAYSEVNNLPPQKLIDKIICDDAEKVLRQLPDNCVDLVFTSPPYNFGLDYGNSGDDTKWENYFDKLFAVFEQCIRVVKFGGRIAVNVQPLFSDYIPSHHIISSFFHAATHAVERRTTVGKKTTTTANIQLGAAGKAPPVLILNIRGNLSKCLPKVR